MSLKSIKDGRIKLTKYGKKHNESKEEKSKKEYQKDDSNKKAFKKRFEKSQQF